MLCQVILQKKQIQLCQNMYLIEPVFQTTGSVSEERSQSADALYFLFSSDNPVNSVETWWMCFHLSRMMADVGCCYRIFFQEIALILGDIFIILCHILFIVLS